MMNKPDDISDFNEIEYDSNISEKKYDLIFVFVFNMNELTKQLQLVIDKQLLKSKGYVYFAYPKKGNRQYEAYIDRDDIFKQVAIDEEKYVQGSDLKFSKMVSLNDVFTVVGFKSEAKKKPKSTNKSSQCVDDYIGNIEDIKQYLSKNKDIQEKYTGLTFGYQKDWARYVYSAKKKETQEKRLSEMETVLAEGYKSLDLYKRDKK